MRLLPQERDRLPQRVSADTLDLHQVGNGVQVEANGPE